MRVPENNLAKILATTICFTAVAIGVISSYSIALKGPFILDDASNLRSLKIIDPEQGIESIKKYVHAHSAGPLGRPISRLSYLIDDWGWPSDPKPFKRTNLLLHLIAGLLVFYLLYTIGHASGFEQKKNVTVAAICTIFWVSHPLNASTTLYVAQRMAILSATFSLLSLIFYIKARLIDDSTTKKVGHLFLSLFFFTCALYSKENSICVPILILVLEITILRRLNFGAFISRNPAFLLLPLACLLIVTSEPLKEAFHSAILEGYESRDFTLEQRILTQPRVLMEYLSQIFLPQVAGLGPFQDDFKISESLFYPSHTASAILLLIGLTVVCIIFRRKQPYLSFSWLFFLGAHSVESSFAPLEIYFEHRNYLPMAGLFFGFGHFLYDLMDSSSNKLKAAFIIVTIGILVNNFTLTYELSKKWESREKLLEFNAKYHPNSIRVNMEVANYFIGKNEVDLAKKIIIDLQNLYPDEAILAIESMALDCMANYGNMKNFDFYMAQLGRSKGDIKLARELGRFLKIRNRGMCVPTFLQVMKIFWTIENKTQVRWSNYGWGKFYTQWGMEFMSVRDFHNALGMFKKAISFNSKDERSQYYLATSYVALGDYKNAEKVGQTLFKSFYSNPFRSQLSQKMISDLENGVDLVSMK